MMAGRYVLLQPTHWTICTLVREKMSLPASVPAVRRSFIAFLTSTTSWLKYHGTFGGNISMNQKQLVKLLADQGIDDGIMLVDGFEDAFIGVTEHQPGRPSCAVYDTEKCIKILMDEDEISHEEAIEFFEYNVTGAFVGDRTPVFFTSIKTPTKKKGK
jgi:hypothetical protein